MIPHKSIAIKWAAQGLQAEISFRSFPLPFSRRKEPTQQLWSPREITVPLSFTLLHAQLIKQSCRRQIWKAVQTLLCYNYKVTESEVLSCSCSHSSNLFECTRITDAIWIYRLNSLCILLQCKTKTCWIKEEQTWISLDTVWQQTILNY